MIEVIPLTGLEEVLAGSDLAALLIAAIGEQGIRFQPRDVVVVSQKVVSKSEDRFVDLRTIMPGPRALEVASIVDKDPRLVELVLRESSEIVRAGERVLITRHRSGHVMANAGVDQSNLGRAGSDWALMLPRDSDRSAARIREALERAFAVDLAVIVSDSFGRPWRQGVVNVAIGASGIPALVDLRGTVDRDGRPLGVTQIGLADMIASAAGLALGEAGEGIPTAIVRGLSWMAPDRPASALIRPLSEDLFR